MSTAPDDFTAKLIDEYRANGGKVGGMFGGMQLLLLHHVGAKSGQERVTPLAYLEDNGHYVIFASKAGAPTNPGWYHNLKADPNVSIEVGDQQYDVVATEATGDERDRLFDAQVERAPGFGDYQSKAGGRVIPAIVLERAAA